ncbi:tetratricopeptide repeat protein [Pseudidiomarina donghaiensis]|uniref:tetratricopeptide repeat protein n=1 Tax=Pseudidiomarina donghaiensis TaxID=519452 RepID=UPI0008E71DC3|nr:tetratricopeptide repeat protein [Pseudidiomarina donghaiensis]SFV20761.1 Tetratricopeptide repeat-containing protein [Pseudidiomarina donghaiensis]
MNSRNLHKTTSCIASAVLVLALAGCTSTGPTQYQPLALNQQEQDAIAGQPVYAQPLYRKLFQEGKRNEVLNRMEIGTAAFYRGDIDLARENFDAALEVIETVYADNENATKARSLWHEEGRKDFKGEPYERAMAYYYRGLIYLIDGQYDNARASFVSGLMQDAFAEEEQNRSDFAMMLLLAGWSAQKMGSPVLAEEAYAELLTLRPDFPIPSADDNVLIIAETGYSPRKLADGMGHYELVFRPGKNFTEKQISVNTGGQQLSLEPVESVYWQATSRGGRPVDKIIEGKASFANTTGDLGRDLAQLGVTARVFSPALGGSSGQVGNTLALIGVASMALSANVKPRADIRYWSRLPDAVHSATMRSNPSNVSAWQAQYFDLDGNPVTLKSRAFRHYQDAQGNHLIWHSSRAR